jgi:hypothetical protein
MNTEQHYYNALRDFAFAQYMGAIEREAALEQLLSSKIDAFHQHKGLWAHGQYLTLLHARIEVMDHPEMLEMCDRIDEATDPEALEQLGREAAELDERLMAEAIQRIAEASIEYDAQINAEDACDDAA